MKTIETSGEEEIVRSMHPCLRGCHEVSIINSGQVGRPIWLVNGSDAHSIFIQRTHTAGEDDPYSANPFEWTSFLIYAGPRRSCCDGRSWGISFIAGDHINLWSFPWIFGHPNPSHWLILILFLDKKSLEACWAKSAWRCREPEGQIRPNVVLCYS